MKIRHEKWSQFRSLVKNTFLFIRAVTASKIHPPSLPSQEQSGIQSSKQPEGVAADEVPRDEERREAQCAIALQDHDGHYNNSLFLSDIHYPEFVFPNIASPKISLTKKTLPKIPYRKFAVSIPLETNSTQLPYREIRGQDRLRII